MAKRLGIWRIGALPVSILVAALAGVAVALAAHALPQVPAPEPLISAVALTLPIQLLVWILISDWMGTAKIK